MRALVDNHIPSAITTVFMGFPVWVPFSVLLSWGYLDKRKPTVSKSSVLFFGGRCPSFQVQSVGLSPPKKRQQSFQSAGNPNMASPAPKYD